MMALLNHVAEAWWSWMWPMFWQVNLLIAIVWLLDLALRRWVWPQVRYALWLLVLVKLVIPPTWSLPTGMVPRIQERVVARLAPDSGVVTLLEGGGFLPTTSGPVRDAGAGPAGAGAVSIPTGDPAAGAAPVATEETGGDDRLPSGPGVTPAAAPAGGLAWQVWPFAAWLLGMAGFAALLLARLGRLRRWHDEQHPRRAIPPWYHELLVEITRDWRMGRLPAIVFSDRVVTPAVCGIWRPVLFLPRDYLDTLSREEARHVLLHELAHLKRGDLWLHAAALVLQIVYWFNPLLALARRQIQHVREICCDLTVAGVLRERTVQYRETLLATARQLLSESVAPGLGLLGVFEEPFRLVARLRWLEQPSWIWRGRAAAAAVALVAFMVPFVLPMASGGAPTGILERDLVGMDGTALRELAGGDARDAAATRVGTDRERAAGAGTAVWGEAPRGLPDRVLYQRNAARSERCILGFCVDRRRFAVSETWIGDGIVAATEPGRTLIVDLDGQEMTYIDHVDECYVRAPLPLDLEDLLASDLRRRYRREQSTGEVEATGRTCTIGDQACREYRVHSWRERSGAVSDDGEFLVYAAADAPCDMETFDAYVEVLRRLYNRDADYRRELSKIRGPQLKLVMKRGGPFVYERIVDELEALETIETPPEVFAVPDGYVEVSRLRVLR